MKTLLENETSRIAVKGKSSAEEKIYNTGLGPKSAFLGGLTGKRILDIGCGTGLLSEMLCKQGNECFGITVSKKEAAEAENRLDKVICADLDDLDKLPLEEGSFDVLLCMDILEHLKSPSKTVDYLKRYLKKDGQLITSLPNVANFKVRLKLLMGKFEYTEFGIMDSTHLRFFTLQSAKAFLEENGFAIHKIRFTHWNWRFPSFLNKMNGSIKQRLTRMLPGLLATQFVIFARRTGEEQEIPTRLF